MKRERKENVTRNIFSGARRSYLSFITVFLLLAFALVLSTAKAQTLNLNGDWAGYFTNGTKSAYVWRIVQNGTSLTFEDVGAGTKTKFSGQLANRTITDSNKKTGTISTDGTKITWSDGVVWLRQTTASPPQPRVFPETYSPLGTVIKEKGLSGGRRTFDQYAWLTSHNSFVNYTDARWAAPNQSRGIIGQLQTDGVRGLMLDVYDFSGSHDATCVASIGSDCYKAGIYLCHGGCSGFPGSTYALPRQNLKDTLDGIADWLGKNRELKDVVTIFFEDYTAGGTLATVIKSSKAAAYIFNPYGEWKVQEKGFPTLEYMQATNKRLLLFTSKAANKDTSLGIAFDQEFNVENYWSIGAGGANYECKTRWGSIPLNKTEAKFNRLFVMNHFRDVPSTPTATFDNKESNLKDRQNRCQTAAGRLPNFIALDFVELGSGKALVDSINAEWEKLVAR